MSFFENTRHRKVCNIFNLIYVREGISESGLYNLRYRGCERDEEIQVKTISETVAIPLSVFVRESVNKNIESILH